MVLHGAENGDDLLQISKEKLDNLILGFHGESLHNQSVELSKFFFRQVVLRLREDFAQKKVVGVSD